MQNILTPWLMHCSDPASILGGVRLPPDTEIIKYTSSIVGPKIPGTTNRGRKKTISLDPPSVSVMTAHSSTGLLIERGGRRYPRGRVSGMQCSSMFVILWALLQSVQNLHGIFHDSSRSLWYLFRCNAARKDKVNDGARKQ